MSSLWYLLRKSLKNTIWETLRKPAKLIPYLLVIALLVLAIVGSLFSSPEAAPQLNRLYLEAAFFAFLSLFFFMDLQKGLTSGDTIFDMNDVNFLFVSPVDQGKILLYGIFRLAKVSFLACFFILFQATTLRQFGIDGGGMVLILAGAMLGVIASTILSLIVYILTNGSPRKQMTVRVIALLTFLPALGTLSLTFLQTRNILETLETTIASPTLAVVPIAGWLTKGIFALLAGNLTIGAGLCLLTLATSVGVILYIMHTKRDYYEDVLVATETSFQKKLAAAEGNVNATIALNTRKVRVARTGVGGFGASAFFYKHLREVFRQNRFGFFGVSSVLFCGGAIVFSLFQDKGDVGSLFILLNSLMWMQMFFIGTGKGLFELYSHYIFLVPASPLQKLLWSNMEITFKAMLEGILLFIIPGVIMALPLLHILMAWLTYVLFTLFLLGINLLSLRWTGGQMSQGLLMLLYVLVVMLAMAPGLAMAAFFGFSMDSAEAGLLAGLTALCAWEFFAALLLLWFSKGILHDCDMMTVKPK